jgi:transcriptional regulator with XRE-family HTH domain
MKDDTSRRLLELRHTLCLTQKDFGERIHISRGYVTSLEKCRQPLNDRIIKLIADTYGVNAEWLKCGNGEMFLDPQNTQLLEVMDIFNKLNPDFQNFTVNQLRHLLEMNQNYRPEDGNTPKEKVKEGKAGEK